MSRYTYVLEHLFEVLTIQSKNSRRLYRPRFAGCMGNISYSDPEPLEGLHNLLVSNKLGWS